VGPEGLPEGNLKLAASREAGRSCSARSCGRLGSNCAAAGDATSRDVERRRLCRAPALREDLVRRAAGCAGVDLAGQGRSGALAALAWQGRAGPI
jgi:hypothetical protein